MGLRIFMHSVNLVLNQLQGALRISGVLYLASLLISFVGSVFFLGAVMSQPGGPTGIPLPFLVILIVVCALYLWIAVAWHRFVLLDETPQTLLPPFHGDRIVAYLGRSLVVFLIIFAIAILLSFVNVTIISATNGSPFALILTSLITLFIALVISYRLAPMFPAAAIGNKLGIRDAWAATTGSTGTIVGLALISALASIIVDLPILLLQNFPGGSIIVFLWTAVTAWFKLLIGVSILTTLYGVFVEKREIA
jgi:hypothetical protein